MLLGAGSRAQPLLPTKNQSACGTGILPVHLAFTEKKSIRLWNRHLACSPGSPRNKQILLQHKQDACSGQLMFKMHPYCYLMVEAKRVKK